MLDYQATISNNADFIMMLSITHHQDEIPSFSATVLAFESGEGSFLLYCYQCISHDGTKLIQRECKTLEEAKDLEQRITSYNAATRIQYGAHKFTAIRLLKGEINIL